MLPNHNQILTAAQMRAAEEELIAAGGSVGSLMQRAGLGAADYIWRIAAGRPVTVLCGPGNNGGDGYVIAEALRSRGSDVKGIAPLPPQTPAARAAKAAYRGTLTDAAGQAADAVLVDCLFGSGLSRPLSDQDLGLLNRLAAAHRLRVAVDLPSGVDADSGAALNEGLPHYDLTLALGAWKFAHLLMPAAAAAGALRLVPLGCGAVPGAASMLTRPHLAPPAAQAHKYTRGLVAVMSGAMPGAAALAARAAQHGGAGYVTVLRCAGPGTPLAELPADMVVSHGPIAAALADPRLAALLAGPGLGRDLNAVAALEQALSSPAPLVLDADALHLLVPAMIGLRAAPIVATPHGGELAALERSFGCSSAGSKPERARLLAQASGMIVVAKGPDTVIAAPDGRIVCATRASPWLSVAGTGDVLAGVIASRLATGSDPFAAACEGVWIHGEAAGRCGAAFSASQLAAAVQSAYAACL